MSIKYKNGAAYTRKPMKKPHHSVYLHIGQRIRERRKLLRMNQSQLAELMGFSYQQMQKYENGTSEVSAGKLLQFAKILNVPAHYFYEGLSLEDNIGKGVESDIIQNNRSDPLHILLGDDNLTDALLFKKSLARCSKKAIAHVVYDGEGVLDFAQHAEHKYGKRRPDLIVLDLALPKSGGVELIRALKKNPHTLSIPVVVLTNSISARDMMDSYRFGASGFIQKSVDLEEYVRSIDIAITYWAETVVLPSVA
jgi:CheY-like chemotaxis protein/DNA-binding transcriptional regulator YiaG